MVSSLLDSVHEWKCYVEIIYRNQNNVAYTHAYAHMSIASLNFTHSLNQTQKPRKSDPQKYSAPEFKYYALIHTQHTAHTK